MNQFSSIARFFHWLIAGLIISQYLLAELAENAKSDGRVLDQLAILANHKSIGILILVLALLRVAYRLKYPPIKTAEEMPVWQHHASNVSHVLLYVFLFCLPLSGWLMSSAKAYSVSWFNLFTLPDLIAPSESIADFFHATHHYLSEALFIVAVIHVAAALKHHFIDKDTVMLGMAGRKSYVLMIVTILLCVVTLGRFIASQVNQTAPQNNTVQTVDDEFSKSDLALWKVDYQDSYIKFTGDQAGAAFTGKWQQWQADIQFNAETLSKSRFNVTIDPSSGFTQDQERDDTIRSSDFFDVAQFPKAVYQANVFKKIENKYQSEGTLTMKGFSAKAQLTFEVIQQGSKTVLIGTSPIDRLQWNIGSGDWVDTSWVGQEVMVEVRVVKLDD